MNAADRYLEHLFLDTALVELRALPTVERQPIQSGTFNDPDRLRRAARWASDAGYDVFTTLNRPHPGITVCNELSAGSKCLTNADFEVVTRVVFDFDAVRPRGHNSTDAEVAMARDRALSVAGYLRSWGWPEPLVACSGNGAHLQYRVKLPADRATIDALNAIYRALQRRFSDDAVSFDSTVRNFARIFRLYGFTNRKNPPAPDRPQRLATCYVPTRWDNVPRSRFFALAEHLKAELAKHATEAKRTERRGGAASLPFRRGGWVDLEHLDVVALFRQAGLYVADAGAGRHHVTCPWAGEHTGASPPNGSDCVVWESHANRTGRAAFHCKHSHCLDRRLIDAVRLLNGRVAP